MKNPKYDLDSLVPGLVEKLLRIVLEDMLEERRLGTRSIEIIAQKIRVTLWKTRQPGLECWECRYLCA